MELASFTSHPSAKCPSSEGEFGSHESRFARPSCTGVL